MAVLSKSESNGALFATGAMLLVGGSVAASSLAADYPVLGGQGLRYLAAGLLLLVWARLRREPLPRPTTREWAWLAALALIGLAAGSVLLIEATAVADPAGVGVVIGTAPLAIAAGAACVERRRPAKRVLTAAVIVGAGSIAAQLGDGTGAPISTAGLLLSLGALAGVVGSTLLAAPILPRLGGLTVTVYGCLTGGVALLIAGGIANLFGAGPVLRRPSGVELASLAYLAFAVTAVVFVAWYAAVERLGAARTGLFNGLIPVTSLVAVALVGTSTVTPLKVAAALAVLAGVLLGLTGSTRQRQDLAASLASSPPAAEKDGAH